MPKRKLKPTPYHITIKAIAVLDEDPGVLTVSDAVALLRCHDDSVTVYAVETLNLTNAVAVESQW